MIQKTKLVRTVFIFAFLIYTGCLFAQTDERSRLLSLEKMRFSAMTKHDTVALGAFLSEDLVYIYASGLVDNKHSLLKDIATGSITYSFIIPEKITATIDGEFAWIYGRANIRFKLSMMTGTIDQYNSFVDIYRLRHNQWQLVMSHNARVERNAPYYKDSISQAKPSIQPGIY